MLEKRTFAVALLSISLLLPGCGGGGGGASTPAAAPAAPEPTIQGDMIAYAPSRGWNYSGTVNGQGVTISMYANPNAVNGVYALTVAAVNGSVPTALTTAANVYNNLAGALGVTISSGNYNVVSEISAGSAAAVPGNPLLVSSNLTLHQTWNPVPGATATVTFIGTVPNSSACPSPGQGVQIRYTYSGYDDTFSYVPGCGLTNLMNNLNGFQISLVSVGSYPSLGQLALARRVESLTLLDTAKSLIGLGHTDARGASLVSKLF